MARKKRAEGGGPGSGDWLNTYADMVTLLLTFFILLFSMSSLDASKYNIIVNAFTKNTKDSPAKIVLDGDADGEEQKGSPAQSDSDQDQLEDIYNILKKFVEDQEISNSVEVSQGDGYVFIRFMNDMLFEPNSAVLKPADREILQFVGNGIKSVQSKLKMITVHGHTAAIPGDPNYAVNDWILSADRANAVVVFFDDTIGINPQKMQAITWGKNKPFTSNDTEEGRSKNRRVEIYISTENLLAEQLDNVYEKLLE